MSNNYWFIVYGWFITICCVYNYLVTPQAPLQPIELPGDLALPGDLMNDLARRPETEPSPPTGRNSQHADRRGREEDARERLEADGLVKWLWVKP